MLLGVISDTHDRLDMIDAALGLFVRRGVGAVVHAGDFVAPFAMRRLVACHLPLHAIYGNNDGERKGLKGVFPSLQDGPLFVELDGRMILVHHCIDWCTPSEVERAAVVITGHTHEVVNRLDGDRLFLNPGECCGWITGRCTAAILDIGGLSAEICELDAS